MNKKNVCVCVCVCACVYVQFSTRLYVQFVQNQQVLKNKKSFARTHHAADTPSLRLFKKNFFISSQTK